MALLLYISTALFLVYATLEITWKMWKRKLSFLPSAPNMPWLGTIPYFPTGPDTQYKYRLSMIKKHNHLYTVWFTNIPVIRIGCVEYAQPLLKSQETITKSFGYDLILKPWLGDGLLISSGSKWKQRRIALTSAFHFSILNDFMEIFEKHALNLANTLQHLEVKEVEIQRLASLSTLDVICETSMGVTVNALNSCDSDYVTAIGAIKRLSMERGMNPFSFFSDAIYRLTSAGKRYYKCLNTVHDFTMNVINENIASIQNKSTEGNLSEAQCDEGGKQKKVFIDVLIDLYMKGEIDINGIREEVDTFMFEGHDTVSSALSWTLYEIGRHPEVQEKLFAEISSISSKDCSLMDKIRSFKYMECVIKESLRLHPPVSFFERKLDKEMVINGNIIPSGTVMSIDVLSIHINAAYWEQPFVFNPSRFEDVEFLKRNPYIYVPFSAGPRNCIGQKFAMLEEKVFLYHILSRFCMKSIQTPEEVKTGIDLVTHSINGISIEFHCRN